MKKHKQICFGALVAVMAATMCYARPLHAEEKHIDAQIPVTCAAETDSESFTYELSGNPSVYETLLKSTLALKNGERDNFVIRYTYPGTYHYMASQKQGTDRRTIYDTTIYEIDVYVTEDADGTLHTEPIAYVQGSTEKKRKLDFHNRRIPSGSYHGKHTEVASTDDLATASGVIAPKTGDTSHPEFYMVSVVLAAAGMILIRRTHKREGGGEDAS